MKENPWDIFTQDVRDDESGENKPGNRRKFSLPFDKLPKWPMLIVLAVVVLGVWLSGGFYRVQPDEEGIILRFGEPVRRAQSGLNYHVPYPFEEVIITRVTRVNKVNVGFSEQGDSTKQFNKQAESLMLTGDSNIVDIDFSVFWLIKNPAHYRFGITEPDKAVKLIAESAMREVIGQEDIRGVLTSGRAAVESKVQILMQKTLDGYEVGVEISDVKLQKVDPPAQVIASFRDVQAAEADKERLRNEAEAYAKTVLPKARGEGRKIYEGAQADKESVIARAQGYVKSYEMLLEEYQKAPQTTKYRLYLEVLEEVLARHNKLLLPKEGKSPYVILPPEMFGKVSK